MDYRELIQYLANLIGFTVVRKIPIDFTEEEKNMVGMVKTITNHFNDPVRLKSTMDAVNYIIRNNIQGDFVECGVWKGGSVIVMLKTLMQLDVWNKDVYLYDTFDGLPLPTKEDVDNFGRKAISIYKKRLKNNTSTWINCSLDEVKTNIESVGYPSKFIHYIKGKVEDTLPKHAPNKISLLRLDTDWYSSTKHNLEILYPKLSKNGILILDDYGAWLGARKAIDNYFNNNHKIFLNRVDNTLRLVIKP